MVDSVSGRKALKETVNLASVSSPLQPQLSQRTQCRSTDIHQKGRIFHRLYRRRPVVLVIAAVHTVAAFALTLSCAGCLPQGTVHVFVRVCMTACAGVKSGCVRRVGVCVCVSAGHACTSPPLCCRRWSATGNRIPIK